MPQINSNTSKRAVAVLVLLLASFLLTACGGSSKSSSSTSTAAAKSTSTSRGPNGGRFAALRECLQKNGITLPKRPAGGGPPQRRGGAGGFLGGGGSGAGPKLPKGVSRAQYEAAIKKCGGFGGGRFGAGGASGRLKSPAYKKALTEFASCMRQNGVDVPEPNTSGKGPIFSTKGLDTASAKFKTAQMKCTSVLRGAFRRPPGSSGPPPSGSGQAQE